MLKHSKAVGFLADQIGEAVSGFAQEFGRVAAAIANEVLDDIGREDLSGREETITPQIAREQTAHLFEAIKSRLDEQTVSGVSFRVFCFKHSEEKTIGADVAGILTFQAGQQTLAKAFLAQAKVGKQRSSNATIRAGDRNLLRQCNNMLARSPAAYVFVYSMSGVYVVPATAVTLKGKGQVDTSNDYYRSLKSFYTDFFKCFAGDPNLGGKVTSAATANEVFRQLNVANGLAITATVRQQELFE